jgi:transcriptional antiterminator RfaH
MSPILLSPVTSNRPAAAGVAWYCLHAQPRHESIAARALRQREDVEVFCPRIRFRRVRAGGQMWMTEALFPGYLFARFDLPSRHREIGHAHGLRGIVHFGGLHPSVPDAVIDQLRLSLGEEELTEVASHPEPGDDVVLTGGALHGLQAVVTQFLPARERIRVLLEFMGRQMEFELPAQSALPSRHHPLRAFTG